MKKQKQTNPSDEEDEKWDFEERIVMRGWQKEKGMLRIRKKWTKNENDLKEATESENGGKWTLEGGRKGLLSYLVTPQERKGGDILGFDERKEWQWEGVEWGWGKGGEELYFSL